MQVGVIVCGEERGFVMQQPNVSLAARRLTDHVVAPLVGAGHKVHTFLCTERGGEISTLSPSLRVRRWVSTVPDARADSNFKIQTSRRLQCYRALEQYERATRVSFDFVLLTRPDAIWYAAVPSLAS
eukprot:5119631-Prymnesium_polylepis.1